MLRSFLLCLLFACSTVYGEVAANRELPQLATNTPLSNGGVFTSSWVDVSAYNSITVAIAASHNCSYSVQFSVNASDADSTLSRSYKTDRIAPPERLTVGRQYARVVITNDSGVDMTYLRFQAMAGDKAPLNFPLDRTLPQHADANAVRTDEYKIDVALGRREGAENWRKFGYNEDVDTAAAETIWSPGGRWAPLDSGETLDVVSSSSADDVGGTGVISIRIIGIDENREYQTEDVTLDGTTDVTTTNSWLGINRVSMLSAGSGGVNAGDITLTASTASTVQALMPAGTGITQQAFFLNPIDRTFIVDGLFWNMIKISGGSSPNVTLLAYYHDTSAGTIARVFTTVVETELENNFLLSPSNPFVVAPGDYLEFVAETDSNNTIVNINFWGTTVRDP